MITDEQIHQLVAQSLQGRQNAHKRTLRRDAEAALRGDAACREMMEHWLAKSREVTVTLPGDLVDAIEKYLATDWRGGCDPSHLGALNAVAHLGERLAALYAASRAGKEGRASRKTTANAPHHRPVRSRRLHRGARP